MAKYSPDFQAFRELAGAGDHNLIPVFRCAFADQLTPVLAYRRLVRPDQRMAPSFLLESVVDGDRVGRYSFVGSRPRLEVIARGEQVRLIDHDELANSRTYACPDPLRELARITADYRLAPVPGLPDFTGGWVGSAGYDVVRYLEGDSLPSPPPDDRGLPDLHMQLYREVLAFDHVRKMVIAITHVAPAEHASLDAAYDAGVSRVDDLIRLVETRPATIPADEPELPPGDPLHEAGEPELGQSNLGPTGYREAVRRAKTYIAAGDIFQVVPSQRFERTSNADPFDVYRALRVVNPSPYMFYLQIDGAILVGSSPEILCRVQNGEVTNRPLAGTRRRGRDDVEDRDLEADLLADPKERAEHIMLVDLGRNDVGRVAAPGTVRLPALMEIERYSHVMHISSTVTGQLEAGRTCWDALQMALPVGTVSGAPKVRAMQIIDELEATRRGPYAGAVGYADFAGNMDMAIALRTLVMTPRDPAGAGEGAWTVHIQVGAGIVADSDPDAEHQETVNKAAALARAVQLAEVAFR